MAPNCKSSDASSPPLPKEPEVFPTREKLGALSEYLYILNFYFIVL
jgi:hypothetical protein